MQTASNIISIALLSAAILTMPILTGCATMQRGAEPLPRPVSSSEQVDDYVESLKQKHPDSLTEEEIAFLQMYEERRQANHLRTLATISAISFIGGVIGVLLIGFTASQD